MTAQPITSEQQDQYRRFVEVAATRALKEADPDKEGLQRLFGRGGEFQNYVVAGIARFTAKVPDYELARAILGRDFIPPEEIAKTRGVIYGDERLAMFGKTLPSQEELEWCRDNGMMLVAGPPTAMSLLDVRTIHPDYFYSKSGGWYSDSSQKFAYNDKMEPVWLALGKEPVSGSLRKNWSEQQMLVSDPVVVVPNAAELIWGLTTYKAVRGIYLLPRLYVRTSSLDSHGHRVSVGDFDSVGLDVSNPWDGYRNGYLGLASARKFLWSLRS